MSPPTIRINTFVNENEKPDVVDPISKVFIISEMMFGFDRLPLLGKENFIYIFLSVMLFVIFNSILIYLTVQVSNFYPVTVMMVFQLSQNIICTLLSFTRCVTMQSYYSELNKFDTNVGCRPKTSQNCIRNVVQATLTFLFIVLVSMIPPVKDLSFSPIEYMPLHFIYVFEVHYFGHLLNLLTSRLKLINHYIESSLSTTKLQQSPELKEYIYFKCKDSKMSQHSMRKLMDLYQIIVDAYDFLIEGIKWQLLVIVISAFISVLGFLYKCSLHAIRSGQSILSNALPQVGVSIAIMIPLFAPCTSGDGVHNEVRKLRELLASRLYENKLDKSNRSIARALLAFTETRDLSFRLLRMLNIDISLPFKFVGLIITYLIILLQFEKVINP